MGVKGVNRDCEIRSVFKNSSGSTCFLAPDYCGVVPGKFVPLIGRLDFRFPERPSCAQLKISDVCLFFSMRDENLNQSCRKCRDNQQGMKRKGHF